MKLPKLLIIDTLENLGIDEENLIKALGLIQQFKKGKYQIILTSGEGKYPFQVQKFVRENISVRKLLQPIKEFNNKE